MAREFVRASAQYLLRGEAVVTDVPFTMACWARANDITNEHGLLSIGEWVGFDSTRLIFSGDVADDPIGLHTNGPGGFVNVYTTTGYSADQWHHACAVVAAVDNRAVYLDGGGKGTSAISRVIGTPDRTSLGAIYTNQTVYSPLDGGIAEAAVWNVALTDREVESLATGVRPVRIRPQSIVAYWPLVRDQDYDLVGGYDMTPVASPTISAHPGVAYGGPPSLWAVAGLVAGVLPGAMDTYRRRRV